LATVTDAGNGDGTAPTFVKNQPVIAVAKGNPKEPSAAARTVKSILVDPGQFGAPA